MSVAACERFRHVPKEYSSMQFESNPLCCQHLACPSSCIMVYLLSSLFLSLAWSGCKFASCCSAAVLASCRSPCSARHLRSSLNLVKMPKSVPVAVPAASARAADSRVPALTAHCTRRRPRRYTGVGDSSCTELIVLGLTSRMRAVATTSFNVPPVATCQNQ